jgi:hypothetical protein
VEQQARGGTVHTFDIRFAKSVGLAGLFEAPANRLGWKGSGRLSIDAQGISIAVRRGLLTLFTRRTRRFPADSLTEAYREGDALRLVFGRREQQEILSVWARGGETAAQIVKLLPTLRTVELDQSTGATRRYRFDWRTALLLLALAVVAAAAISLALRQSGLQVPWAGVEPDGASSSTAPLPNAPVVADSGIERSNSSAAPAGPARTEVRRNVSPSSSPSSAARRDAGRNGQITNDAGSEISSARDAAERATPSAGHASSAQSMSSRDAAVMLLEVFEEQSARGLDDDGWWQLTVYIHTTPEFQQQDLWPLREAMLAVSRAWRAHDAEFAERLTDQVHMIAR